MPSAADSASLAEAGRCAARRLVEQGMGAAPAIDDPLTPVFADHFVEALAEGLDERFGTGIGRDVREGASRIVRSSNVEREHGLVEVLQNADDLGASELRIQIGGDGRSLHVSHDGTRVRAPHVLGMAQALITTKTSDERATGKFGVGLKTLSRMSDRFSVHSWPYAFEVRDQTLRPAQRIASIDGVYDLEAPDTLLILHLQKTYDVAEFETWLQEFEPGSLLFLRSVRRLLLFDAAGKVTHECGLVERANRKFHLPIDNASPSAEEVVLEDPGSGQLWTRVSLSIRPEAGLFRTDKKTPAETPLAVAFPHSAAAGRFYAGLPLAIGATLPFSVNAQFDTDTSRTDLLQDEGWNEWLLKGVGELVTGATRHYLEAETARGWRRVPLVSEVADVEDSWLREQLVLLVERVHTALREDVQLPIGSGVELADLSYEAEAIDGELTGDDLQALAPDLTPLPTSLRDRGGRWRAVLDALECGEALDVDDAVEMFAWDDEELGLRPGDWYVRLIAAGLEDDLGWRLRDARCLLAADGSRLSPVQAVDDSLVLAEDGGSNPLIARLGLLRPLASAFYVPKPATRVVAKWLQEDVGVRTESSIEQTLHALATRDLANPLQLDDEGAVALFDAFQAAPSLAAEVGREVGERILLEGIRRRPGKRPAPHWVRPARAYLPRTSWAQAAKDTPDLVWLHRRYYGLLRTRTRGSEQPRRRNAASIFLRHLGAELAPRLKKRRTNKELWGERATLLSREDLTETQRAALDPDSDFNAVMDDYLSPDLEAVLRDIAKDRIPQARKRAQQLINAMERSWSELYAGREDAETVRAYGQMQQRGKVPATWRAVAAELQWMTNEQGQRRQPRHLAVRTPAFQAFLGHAPRKYAYGLEARRASSPVVRAVGFETQPMADTLLSRLEEVRERELSGKGIEKIAVENCYAALAAMSPDPQARGRNRRMGGETVSRVKARFTRGRLVRAGGTWSAPRDVFIGRPIFHQHGRFVPESAERLWVLLGMQRPTVADCITVLRDIAGLGSQDGELPVLLETYRYIDQKLAADEPTPKALATLPLWTGDGWRVERPIYAIRDRTLEDPLGEHVPVWHPPLPIATVPRLCDALGVSVLGEATFTASGINRGSRSAGSAFDALVQATFKHLRSWLAAHDGELYELLGRQLEWDRLVKAKVALNARLQADVPIPGYGRVMVPRRAHFQREPDLVLAIADRDAIEDAELIAGVLGSAAGAEDAQWHVLVHGWIKALKDANADASPSEVHLSEPEEAREEGAVPVETKSDLGRGARSRTPDRSERSTAERDGPASQRAAEESEPIRPLKQLADIEATVVVVDGGGREQAVAEPNQRGAPSGLRPPGKGNRIRPSTTTASRRKRSEPDRETRALELVAREAGKLWNAELRDVRDKGGVGADAIDDSGRYYELKAHSRDIPPEVALEPSEFDRARLEGTNFVLCVVGGLEEGHETVVQLIPDPLRSLPWWTGSAIKVGGLRESVQPPGESTR